MDLCIGNHLGIHNSRLARLDLIQRSLSLSLSRSLSRSPSLSLFFSLSLSLSLSLFFVFNTSGFISGYVVLVCLQPFPKTRCGPPKQKWQLRRLIGPRASEGFDGRAHHQRKPSTVADSELHRV